MTSGNNFQILKEIILKRKAIRVFDRKKIPSVELEKVCQIAMCAPSWYGLEPWSVLVIADERLKKLLFEPINSQKQVINSSHLILIFAYKGEEFNWETENFKSKIFKKYGKMDEKKYKDFCQQKFFLFRPENYQNITIWAKQQCFILLENFLLLLTSLNFATSPMGGFQNKKVVSLLEKENVIPHGKLTTSVVIAVGYPENEAAWNKKWKKISKKDYQIID